MPVNARFVPETAPAIVKVSAALPMLIVLLALLNDTVPVRVLEPTSDNEPELFITIGVEILKLLPVIKIPLPELTVTPVELPKPVLLLTAKVPLRTDTAPE